MNVLLDHCVPKPFGRLLVGLSVRTTQQMGWEELKNGDLLQTAAAKYDVFITVDKGIKFQQHAATLPIPVIALTVPSNRRSDLAPLAPRVIQLLSTELEKKVYVINSAI